MERERDSVVRGAPGARPPPGLEGRQRGLLRRGLVATLPGRLAGRLSSGGRGLGRSARIAIVLAVMAAVGGIAAWRAPQIADVLGSLADVRWWWAAAAIGANLASLALRGLAWIPVLGEAVPGRPEWRHGLSAYTIGQFGNALLPGRLGEVAKIAVICRRMSGARATWAAVGGSILAHRLLDAVPLAGLALFVLLSSGIPGWAVSGVLVAVLLGMGALGVAAIVARRGHAGPVEGGRLLVAIAMARRGLGVLRAPVPALWAVLLLSAGWAMEVVGAWMALRAFGIDAPGEAAGLVVLVTNALMAFPFWPGNVGLLQAGVALALVPWGVASATGIAYGIGLQAIELLTALGPGLVFLAAEGLSFAALRSLSESGLRELEAGPPDGS